MSLLFRRRGSNASSSSQEEKCLSASEIQKMLDNAEDLYAFALDELNFASDSWGSLYYEGDQISAREAIDNCTNAFMQVLHQTQDHQRSQLHASITPKLARLEEQYNALPPIP
ncbi:hypothetical protein BX666DRAFT_1860112 [Dichotomocladium elegans]|nr:hypothetical protein BX666DRAFT_1860112 [Dichotomocladium elegans]